MLRGHGQLVVAGAVGFGLGVLFTRLNIASAIVECAQDLYCRLTEDEKKARQRKLRNRVHAIIKQSGKYEEIIGPASRNQRVVPHPSVQHKTYEFSATGEDLPYALFVPPSYQAGTPAPLIVGLHGNGGPHDAIMGCGRASILSDAGRHGAIIVTPLGYHRSAWYGARTTQMMTRRDISLETQLSEQDVMEVLALIRKEYTIDPDRIYLLGHSAGGAGAYHLAMKYPQLFAAVAVACPGVFDDADGKMGYKHTLNDLPLIKHLPVFVLCGDEDMLRLHERARVWVAKMRELGMTHEYLEIAGGKHIDVLFENGRESVTRIVDFLCSHRRPASS